MVRIESPMVVPVPVKIGSLPAVPEPPMPATPAQFPLVSQTWLPDWKIEPLTSRVPRVGALPIPTLVLVVSAMNRLEVPAAFWIWRAVVLLLAFWASKVPVNLLLPEKVWGPVPFSKATLADSLASLTVPLLRLVALRLVRLEPFRTGKMPPPVSWTSWLAPLKLLPCRVTLADSLASLSVPLDRLVALRLVRPAPEPVKELLALEKVLLPEKVWLALSRAMLAEFSRLVELSWVPLTW